MQLYTVIAACMCLSLALPLSVCLCVRVILQITRSWSPSRQSCHTVTLHHISIARCIPHALFAVASSVALCSHMKFRCCFSFCFSSFSSLLIFFFFVLSFSCFVHGEFFFLYFICARVCPVRLQLPYPVPVFFFGVSGKGLKTWVRSECPCVCVFVCVRGQSPRLNFHVKRILKHHRFVRFSFRFALLFVRPALYTFHIHSYFHLLTPSRSTSLSLSLLLCGLKSLCGKVFAFYFWSWRVDAKTT